MEGVLFIIICTAILVGCVVIVNKVFDLHIGEK